MSLTFAATHRHICRGKKASQRYGLVYQILEGMYHGRFIISGVPLDMSPRELFNQPRRELQYLYAFKLVGTNPLNFNTNFLSLTGSPARIDDFSILLNQATDFLDEEEERVPMPDRVSLRAPILGGFLVHDPDVENYDEGFEPITVYPPNLTFSGYRWALNNALMDSLRNGFQRRTNG